jgi:hypothetical protein
MALLSYPSILDAKEVARRIKKWLDRREFETRAFQTAKGAYILKARKASKVRTALGADRALEVEIRASNNETVVNVRQGSWKTNVISNVAWAAFTGGMNLAITGWSIVIQKELESYIRSIFNELSGTKEVDLENDTISDDVTQNTVKGSHLDGSKLTLDPKNTHLRNEPEMFKQTEQEKKASQKATVNKVFCITLIIWAILACLTLLKNWLTGI